MAGAVLGSCIGAPVGILAGVKIGGLAALSGLTCENLRKLNTVGAYKCTDAALQCLLQSHPTILLYHKPEKFGEGFTE